MLDEVRWSRFKEKVESKSLLLGLTSASVSPVTTEMIGYAGFDFVIIDTETLNVNSETMEGMVRAAECSNTISVIKLKESNRVMIADALNTGAPMCKVPHVRTAADLREAMDAAYFFPRGHRGLCPVARANRYGQGRMAELVEWTNREVRVIPVIEEVEAIDHIDELMAVDGIEIYDVGPVDLSQAYGVAPHRGFANPIVEKALDRVIAAAQKHNKRVMTVPIFDTEMTPDRIK